MIINKNNISFLLFLALCALVLILSIRGLPGNPASKELNTPHWEKTGPFESSGERGRFALAHSYIENGSLQFSLDLARFSTPDLAISKSGQYVSLFAPGVSFLIIPGYLAGKYFGISQVGAYSVIVLFAFLNILLIRAISIRLGANPLAANIGALTFVFASPAFSYGVTLSQHHISAFLILLSVYLLFRKEDWLALPLFWFLFALSIVVDNPNIFFIFPLAIYFMGRMISVNNKIAEYVLVSIKPLVFFTIMAAVIPIAFFLWFNHASQGSYFQISGSLERVTEIDENGRPIGDSGSQIRPVGEMNIQEKKSLFSFFQTRNLANGFYIHFFSPDRGIINYTPVILLGFLGIYLLYRQNNSSFGNLLAAIAGFNILVYSMWGDPYGGWSFGSRYLIPLYALLGIGIAVALSVWRKNEVFLGVFIVLFGYSAYINTLGALTTNVIPPKIEVLELEKTTGREEKYTYERNWQYMDEFGLKSYIYQVYLENKIAPKTYFQIVFMLIAAGSLALLYRLRFESRKENLSNFSKI